jgi:cytochrome c
MRSAFIALSLIVVCAPASLALAQDAAAGKSAFRPCMACHSIAEEQNRVGPHLVGIVDRPVASIEGFNYSPALVAYGEGKVWDEATLSAYLANPRSEVEGTRMAFAGVKDPQALADLIAYLADPAAAP